MGATGLMGKLFWDWDLAIVNEVGETRGYALQTPEGAIWETSFLRIASF